MEAVQVSLLDALERTDQVNRLATDDRTDRVDRLGRADGLATDDGTDQLDGLARGDGLVTDDGLARGDGLDGGDGTDQVDGLDGTDRRAWADRPEDAADLDAEAGAMRTILAGGAWVDVRRGWWPGWEGLFERLTENVPWQAERRWMYDRVVDVPRLLRYYGEGEDLPDPGLDQALAALNALYGAELGEEFRSVGLCLYRDGRDSVAWHGDRIGRGRHEDTMVAILSLGARRGLLLRPRGGGRAIRHEVGAGDLLVMGGSCQRTWEHSVPKTTRAVGPRISVQFRPRGVG